MLPAIKKVLGIITHKEPHVDEADAISLLRRYGEKNLPGIANAPIIFWENDGEIPDGRTWEEFWGEGYVLVGVGGSPLDEHATLSEEGKDDDCATTLTIKELGVDNPAVLRVAEAVKHNDLNGGADALELPNLLRALYREYDPKIVLEEAIKIIEALEVYVRENDIPKQEKLLDLPSVLKALYFQEGSEKAIEWTIHAMNAKILEQKMFHTSTRDEYEKHSQFIQAKVFDGKTITVAVIDNCDDEQVASYARFNGAAVVILRNTEGNMFVSASKKRGLRLNDSIRIIRVEEQMAADLCLTTDFDALGSSGRVKGAENWTFFQKGQCLFNGRLKGKGVLPTRLAIESVVEIVKAGLNPRVFCEGCFGRECSSTQGADGRQSCPWYRYGLQRCRDLRFKKHTIVHAPPPAVKSTTVKSRIIRSSAATALLKKVA